MVKKKEFTKKNKLFNFVNKIFVTKNKNSTKKNKTHSAKSKLFKKIKINLFAKINKKNSFLFNSIIFSIKFFVILFLGIFILDSFHFIFLTSAEAKMVSLVFGVSVFDNYIFSGSRVYEISDYCSGLFTFFILLGLIFASKSSWKISKKLLLALSGLGIILCANIIRILIVIFSPSVGLNPEFVHEISWFGMSFIALSIWYFSGIGSPAKK
jgi:exosortase/archaeosortase family protein